MRSHSFPIAASVALVFLLLIKIRQGNSDAFHDGILRATVRATPESMPARTSMPARDACSGEKAAALCIRNLALICCWLTQAMMDAAAACGVSPSGVEFVGTQGTSKQKTVGNSKTRQVLGNWVPKHKSFIEFMEAGGRDWYSTCGLF